MRATHVDRTLLGITITLVVSGLLIFLSASLGLLTKDGHQFAQAAVSQLVLGFGGGFAALALVLRTPTKLIRRYALAFFGVSWVLTWMVFVPHIGISTNGAARWINLYVTTFQPSELLKIAYIVFLASFFATGKNKATDWHGGLLPFAVVTALTGLVLLLQPDTDTFLVIAASGFAIIFAAGMRFKDLGLFLGTGIVLIVLLVLVRPYLWQRIETFIDPLRDPQGAGYQIQQSLIAVGSGQLVGRGFGQSIQKFNYLPEASSDSIFAVYAEEFGFVGAILMICGFLFFGLRGMWVAARSHDAFGGLLAVGIVTLILAEAFLNMAAMVGIAPVGGLPLPFISHGGSALMVTLAMVGLLLSVSRGVRT